MLELLRTWSLILGDWMPQQSEHGAEDLEDSCRATGLQSMLEAWRNWVMISAKNCDSLRLQQQKQWGSRWTCQWDTKTRRKNLKPSPEIPFYLAVTSRCHSHLEWVFWLQIIRLRKPSMSVPFVVCSVFFFSWCLGASAWYYIEIVLPTNRVVSF